MAVISFQFSGSTDRPAQERLLGRLKKAPGVRTVGRIDEASLDNDIARMCFVETADTTHTDSIVETLHQAPGVETVSVEPQRGLN